MRPPLPLGAHGDINTRKKPNGKWAARAYYRDSMGKRRDTTITAGTKAAAIRALKEKIANNQPVEYVTAEMRLSDFANRWYSEYAPTVSKNTARITENIIRNNIVPNGEIRLREITVPWLEAQITKAHEIVDIGNGRHRGGVSTAIRLRTVYKMLLAEAVRIGAITHNPADQTKAVAREGTTPTALTAHQIRRLRARMDAFYETRPYRAKTAEWLPDMVAFLAGTGARVGEAISLRWEDIDFASSKCLIRSTAITSRGASEYQGYTKTRNNRIITLPGWLRELLLNRARTAEYVFPSSTGGMVKYGSLRRNWGDITNGSEFAGTTPKILRASVATMIERELGAEAAALQLGHDDVQTTRKSYVERRGVSDARSVLESL